MTTLSTTRFRISSQPSVLFRYSLPLCVVGIALLISCFSGFEHRPAPFVFKWSVSPLGLLFNFNSELLGYTTAPGFAASFTWALDYLWVFLKTCALESPFYFLIFRRQGYSYALGALFVANLLTHPAVYFVFPWLFNSYLTMALAAEVFAPLVEAVFVALAVRGSGARPVFAVIWVILANLFSWQMGAFF